MKTEEAPFTIINVPGYAELYGAVADFVHGTPHPRLAAAAVLNAICAVALTTMGGDALTDLLRRISCAPHCGAAWRQTRVRRCSAPPFPPWRTERATQHHGA